MVASDSQQLLSDFKHRLDCISTIFVSVYKNLYYTVVSFYQNLKINYNEHGGPRLVLCPQNKDQSL